MEFFLGFVLGLIVGSIVFAYQLITVHKRGDSVDEIIAKYTKD
jgi:hypothetical protein